MNEEENSQQAITKMAPLASETLRKMCCRTSAVAADGDIYLGRGSVPIASRSSWCDAPFINCPK